MTKPGVKNTNKTNIAKPDGRGRLSFTYPGESYLYKIGKEDPPITVERFIDSIRFNEDKKKNLSPEYKVLGKLCPVYRYKKHDPIFQIINPQKYYYNKVPDRHLRAKAYVKLVLDENAGTETENDLLSLRDIYLNARQGSKMNSDGLFVEEARLLLEEVRLKQQRDLNAALERKKYYQNQEIQTAINSRRIKELGLCLTFRGLLTYLLNELKYRMDIENKRFKEETEEKDKEKVKRGRISRINISTGRIHQVIRNRSVIKEAPFLEYSELLESQGFDVVSLLLQISAELADQLHIDAENDRYLLRRATERYLVEFDRFFSDLRADGLKGAVRKRYPINIAILEISPGIPLQQDKVTQTVSTSERIANRISIIATLNEYRKEMAWRMRTWKLNDLKEIDATINKSLEIEHRLRKEYR